MSFFRKRFKSAKCKALLKLVLIRISIVRKKHEIQLKHMRQDVSRFLQIGQDENAQTRVAHVMREQNVIDAFNMLESFCELVIKQMPILRAQKACPANLIEAVSSLLFAGPRCAKLPELLKVRNVFAAKYGKDFVTAAEEPNNSSGVSKEIIEKLSSSTSIEETKAKHIMHEIALEYGIKWDPITLEPKLSRDCNETNQSKYIITESKSKTVWPTSRSESLLLTSKMQAKESFSLAPSSSIDDEDDAHFDGRNQFIVSVMQIRTLVASHCEVNSHNYVSQRDNFCNPCVETSGRASLKKQQQEAVGGSLDKFMEESKINKTGVKGHIPFRDVVSAAEAAAISADRAAAAAKAAARLALNAISQKASVTGAETVKESDDLMCGPAIKVIKSNSLIPVQNQMPCPIKISVQTGPGPQQQAAIQNTRLSTDHFCNGSLSCYPIVDPGMRNKSSDGKKEMIGDDKSANEGSPVWNYNTGTILSLKTNSQRAADQHHECITSLKPFEPGYRNHHAQTNGLVLSPGTKETTDGLHPISRSNHISDFERCRASKNVAGAAKSADMVHSCPVDVQLNDISRNVFKQNTCPDLITEQTRRQENTKIHPVTSIPGIIVSEKGSNRPHFYRRMHSCLLG